MNSPQETKKDGTGRTYDLYIGHVPRSIQEHTFMNVFSKFGTVVDVLIRHGSGSYGYGIVKFKNKKDADKVLCEVEKICVDDHVMEIRNGKRSSHPAENNNGASAMVKSVSFAEPCTSIQHFGNIHLMDPALSATDFNYSAYPAGESAPVPVTVEIMCTNVMNAVTFHGCPISKFEELQLLSIKLNSICPNLTRLLKKPAVNKVYGAVYDEDFQWYRCKVLQCAATANSSSCIVQYIDYGNIAEVCYTDMVALPEPLKNLSPFAVKCVFSNLMPIPKVQSYVTYLHHLVNSRMSLVAFYLWLVPEYQVTKCSCNGIDVIAELVRNGFAVYRSPATLKATSPDIPDDMFGPKTKENRKSKKANGTVKKTSDIHNGITKHSIELKNEVTLIQPKNGRNPPLVESNGSQDFMPKKIIKRGSGVTILSHQYSDENKSVNHLLKLDSVIANVKVINNIRSLIPLHTYDDLIDNAVDLLRNEMNIAASDDSTQFVESARKNYCKALAEIKNCSDQGLLSDLKEKRDEQKYQLCSELKKYLDAFDSSLIEKRKRFQETITALESNSTAWLNVYLPKIPDNIEDLLTAFNNEKDRKRNAIKKARKSTDEKRAKFLKVYTDLGKEFSLSVVNREADDSSLVNTVGKKGSWALKFDEALTEFEVTLENERKISTEIEDRSYVSVIQYILEKLDIPKDKVDTKCEVYEKYKSLYEDLTLKSDFSPVLNELYTLSKTIKDFNPCSENVNTDKLSEQFFHLHTALLREDALMVDVVKASAQHFPELIWEHPELNLEEYQKHFCLLKLSWDVSFFPYVENCNRIEPSYISRLAHEPVVIKEFDISHDSWTEFLKKIKTWNEIRSNSLVKVKGLFKSKTGNIMYAVLPPVWETLYDKPLSVPVDYKLALNILQQVLDGLCDIHSRGIIHGAVHPMSVLYSDGQVLLDLNFDKQRLQDKLSLKGINFHVADEGGPFRSADMYGFGCLVLWVLFPNLSFQSPDMGVPNINAFQSIIQDLLHTKDFNSLCSLLNVNSDIRPSSRVLRSNGFLKDLRIMSEASSAQV